MKKMLCVMVIAALIIASGCSQKDSVIPSATTASTSSFTATAMPEPSKTVKKDIVNPNRTYSYEQMLADAKALQSMYPDLISTEVVGHSVEGRDILLIKLGKGKKKVIFAGAHHAREYITSAFLMETVDEYARAYEDGNYKGYDIAELLDKATVFFVPMVNPDGVNLVQNGLESVKDPGSVKKMRMMQKGYDEWKANIRGVDLNRQYPCHWEEKESNTNVPSSEMYKGKAPATEPEVQAVMELCSRNEFALGVSFHTKGEVIYWADSGTEEAIPAGASIAETLAGVTGYKLMPVSEDPAVYGAGFENWFRQEFSRPGFCIELTPTGNGSAPHDDSEFTELIWNKAETLCAELVDQALNK